MLPDESVEEKWCKKRRGGSDTVQFLKEHSEMEFKFKKEELEAKKSEHSLLTEQQKQQQQMISMFQQQLQQQNQQQQLQQQQTQQQLQQMQTLISENVRAQIECIAMLLATSSKGSRELCCVVDFKKLLLVPKISGTSSLKLLQSCCVCIAGCTYNTLTESHQLKTFYCLFQLRYCTDDVHN